MQSSDLTPQVEKGLAERVLGHAHLRVVVMEDEQLALEVSKNHLRKLGFAVYTASDIEEVIRYAVESHIEFFILDIDMGQDRGSEGLDALERLKQLDTRIFVAIYTSKRDELREQRASRLGRDVYREKSTDKRADMVSIVGEYFRCRIALFQSLDRDLPRGRKPGSSDLHVAEIVTDNDQPQPEERNRVVLKRLLSDTTWVEGNLGKHVAIVDGELLGMYLTEDDAIEELMKQPAGSSKLLSEICRELPVIDLPSILEISDLNPGAI